MKQFYSRIIKNQALTKDFFELHFEWDTSAKDPIPGQFLTIRISNESVPLLRRPFALSGFDKEKNRASIIYQRRGIATSILTSKQPDDMVDIIAPLGNPFPVTNISGKTVLVAGGVGLGPMVFLCQFLEKNGGSPLFVFGARTSSLLPDTAEFCQTAPAICTDDGSQGYKGNCIEYLSSEQKDLSGCAFFGCGPEPMLKALHQLALKTNSDCFVSVEQVMACGVGACMGCVVKTNQGYQRACKEGPVFKSKDIIWE
ncbi:Dihydroorotate dehydrogenase electron transfer subunit [Chitinispirillum alkaliphilum]|nr:Dihydroorotate dehydrogenase electron transfer subunit [Chitinispirillum alkaliphilum]